MAAGLGFKTFNTGDVLTAADVNGYLMQGVLVFADATARDAAITSPQEGQFAYTKDNNSLWYYTGSAWAASGATGDIEGVTAGVGISGGGTSGTVTITNDMATTITAAGDIIAGTGNGTYDNLPIGTTGQVLTADTTVSPYKLKWATPATGSDKTYTLLNAGGTSLSGASTVTVNVSAYNSYLLRINGASSVNASTKIRLRINANGDEYNYEWSGQRQYDSGTPVSQRISWIEDTGTQSTGFELGYTGNNEGNFIYAYAFIDGGKGTGVRSCIWGSFANGTSSSGINAQGVYVDTTAITSLSIASASGNLDAGTLYIYGAN